MKSIELLIILACLATACFGQEAKPEPTLSSAERTALAALEQQKREAQTSFGKAQQQEAAIEREFATAHPGYHINPTTLAVEKTESPKAPEPKK